MNDDIDRVAENLWTAQPLRRSGIGGSRPSPNVEDTTVRTERRLGRRDRASRTRRIFESRGVGARSWPMRAIAGPGRHRDTKRTLAARADATSNKKLSQNPFEQGLTTR